MKNNSVILDSNITTPQTDKIQYFLYSVMKIKNLIRLILNYIRINNEDFFAVIDILQLEKWNDTDSQFSPAIIV